MISESAFSSEKAKRRISSWLSHDTFLLCVICHVIYDVREAVRVERAGFLLRLRFFVRASSHAAISEQLSYQKQSYAWRFIRVRHKPITLITRQIKRGEQNASSDAGFAFRYDGGGRLERRGSKQGERSLAIVQSTTECVVEARRFT